MRLYLSFLFLVSSSVELTRGQLFTPQVIRQLTPLNDDQVTWAANLLKLLPPLHEIYNKSLTNREVSEPCRSHLQSYALGLSSSQPWALKMFDASTKFPESILNGVSLHLGNFDECLAVQPPDFKPQHCGPNLVFTQGDFFSLSLNFASCVPHSCSTRDLQEAMRAVLDGIFGSTSINVAVTVSEQECYTNDKPELDADAYFMVSVFCLIGLMVLIGTAYDYYEKHFEKPKSVVTESVTSFSLRRNWMTLISTRHPGGSITCLHGLRVLSLWWIMLCHRFGQNLSLPIINPLAWLATVSQPLTSLLLNGYMSVDTFFFLSGFLICHVYLGDVERGRKFNVFSFYAYRYIRLTTCLALLVGFYVCLLRHIGYGPRWRASVDWQMEHCDKYWWISLLYLTNYLRFDHDTWTPAAPFPDCVDQGWYLTVDMQLAWLAPLVLVPLVKWPKLTVQVVLPLLVLASCFTPFTSTYINNFAMVNSFYSTVEESRKWVVEMYWPTHMRATPYLLGMVLAYFMFKVKDKRIDIPKWLQCILWASSTAVCLTIVMITAIQYSDSYVYDPLGAAFYAGFHRVGWSFGLSWIIFACTRGYGGPVNWILSWKLFLPFSRLSYCTFLSHFVILFYDCGQMRTYSNYTNFNNIMDFFSDIWATTLFIGLPMHLFVEAPTLNLLRIFFRRGNKNVKTEHIIDAENKDKENETKENSSAIEKDVTEKEL